MIIGTDASITECINTGYLMMKVERKDFSTKKPIDPNKVFIFGIVIGGNQLNETITEKSAKTITFDRLEKSHEKYDDEKYLNFPNFKTYHRSLNDLLETYKIKKENIDNCCGYNHSLNISDYINIYDVLNLASDIESYCGLDA